jgi:tetratricopeptide (TPR) repeat protein
MPNACNCPVARAMAMEALANLAWSQRDTRTAGECWSESLAVFTEQHNVERTGRALLGLGLVATENAQFDRAADLLERSLDAFVSIDSPRGVSFALTALAETTFLSGDAGRSRSLLDRALTLREALGEPDLVAETHHVYGEVLRLLGDVAAAREHFDTSLRIAREVGNTWMLAWLLESYAGLAIVAGHFERGLRLAGAAQAIRDEMEAPRHAVWRFALDPFTTSARSSLGTAAADNAWSEGKSMSVDAAVHLALGNQ